MNQRNRFAVALAVLSLASCGRAEEGKATLKVGDAAPALVGGKWLKGAPVDKLEPGKIYVIEFWATWCGPCKEAIPHVSALQKQYVKDITFIGQDVLEDDASLVEPFIKSMGDSMNYRVRADDVKGGDPQEGAMVNAWMKPAGQETIPASFIVGKDGKIAFIGHPMELESVLPQIVAGTFDGPKYAAESEKVTAVIDAANTAMEAKKPDEAIAKFDEIEKLRPGMAKMLAVPRFAATLDLKKYDEASKQAAGALVNWKDDAEILATMAWIFATREGLEQRDLPLAEKLATQAADVGQRKDFQPLHALARVYFEEKKIDQAIATENNAIAQAPADAQEFLKTALDQFSAAKTLTTAPATP